MTRRSALKFLQIDDPNPSQQQIKKSFRRLASTFHPDKNDMNNQSIYNNLFQQLNESYNVLIAGSFETDAEAEMYEKESLRNRKIYLERIRKEKIRKELERQKKEKLEKKSKKRRKKTGRKANFLNNFKFLKSKSRKRV